MVTETVDRKVLLKQCKFTLICYGFVNHDTKLYLLIVRLKLRTGID
jgi:hypothetical protein